jgi:hypothetical protein
MSNTRGAPLFLDGSNYPAWSFLMKAKLDKLGVLDIARGIIKRPVGNGEEPVKPEELHNYNELNCLAYIDIFKHLDAANLDYVAQTIANANLLCGFSVWQLLKQKYAGDDYIAKDAALERFLDLEYHDSPAQFIAKARAANL